MGKIVKHLLMLFFFLSITTCLYAKDKAYDPEARLQELGIVLVPVGTPKNHVEARRVGNLVYVSGQVPADEQLTGKLKDDAKGLEAARSVGIALISALKSEIGDLRKVKQIAMVNGWINTAEGVDSAKVLDGVSDLLVDVFGERGKSARFALGVSIQDTTMEVSMVVEVE